MTVDLRLVWAAMASWLSAWWLVGFDELAGPGLAALWALAGLLLAGAVLLRRPRVRTVLAQAGLCLAAAALVASAVAVAAPGRLPPDVREAVARHAVVDATFSVGSAPVETAFIGGFPSGPGGDAERSRIRFRGTLTGLELSGRDAVEAPRTVPMTVPVVVFVEAPRGPSLQIGSVIRVAGALRLAEPGDAAAALFFARTSPETIAAPPWWLGWANELRAGFADAAGELPGDGGDLLPGLAIGDTSAVDDTLDASMKTSSLSHLTAVSGANCAVVTAGILLLGGYLRLRRPARLALALFTLLGFVVLVTPEPSVLRAALMASVLLLSIGSGRPGRGLPLLALVVILILAVDPWMARNYGFALSVLATAGLLVLAAPLGRLLGRWMPSWLGMLIAIPLAAQLACQPVLVLLSPTLPLYGVPANLLAGPAAPVATVIGLVGCLLLPWLPGVAWGVLQLGWLPAAWIAAVASTTAGLPASRLPWFGGVAGVFVTGALTVIVIALVLRPTTAERPWWRVASVAVLIVACASYAGSLIGTGLGRAVSFPTAWQIAACDIGQGDAVVVRDGDSHALIDAGPDPALLTACLDTLGIDRIELLVLTHYDLDHIGGVAAVIGMVDTAIVGIPENQQDERLHVRLADGGADVRQVARGDTGTLGALRWDVLWPVPGSPVMQTGNPGSVTIGFDGRGIRSIFLGDLDEEAQNALRRASSPGPVDVVKVAHHGSADQSAELYRDLRATVGLISVGADNGYGHPTDRVLEVLAEAGTAAVRTDRQGMSLVAPDPGGDGSLIVWTEKADTGPVGRPG